MLDGADMILTNTYQTSVEGYMEHLELTAEASVELIRNTVRLAHMAKERFLRECKDRTSNPVSNSIPCKLLESPDYTQLDSIHLSLQLYL